MEEELLIEHVRTYPILYDLNIRCYRNQIARKEAWEEIGGKIGQPGDLCKDTWRKLRNAYTTAIKRRKTKSGATSKKMAKWVFEDQMSFLNMTEAPRQSLGNSSGISQDETQELDNDADDNLETVEEDSANGVDLFQSQNITNKLLSTNELDIVAHEDFKSDNTRSETAQHFSQNTSSQTCVHDDDDEMFFLSLAKFVKKLNPAERIRVKSEVSQAVFQAEYRNLQTPELQHSQSPTDRQNTESPLVTNSSHVGETSDESKEIKTENDETPDCDYEIRIKLEDEDDESFNAQTNYNEFVNDINLINFQKSSNNSCTAVQNETENRIDDNASYNVSRPWKEREIKIEAVAADDTFYETKITPEEDETHNTQTNDVKFVKGLNSIDFKDSYNSCPTVQYETQIRNDTCNVSETRTKTEIKIEETVADDDLSCYEKQIRPEEAETKFNTQTNKTDVVEDVKPMYVEKPYGNCSAVQNDTQTRIVDNAHKLGVNRKFKAATKSSAPQRSKDYRVLGEQEQRRNNAVAAKEYRRRKKPNVDESLVLVEKPVYRQGSAARSAAQRQREYQVRKRQEQIRKQIEGFFPSITTDQENYGAFPQ